LIPFAGNWNVDDAAARADLMTVIRDEPVYALGVQIGLADLDDPDNFRIEPNVATYATKGQAYTVTYLHAPVFDAQGRPLDWAPATQSMTPAAPPAPVARPEPEPTRSAPPIVVPEPKPATEASMPTFGP
jgi:hypothetical protein